MIKLNVVNHMLRLNDNKPMNAFYSETMNTNARKPNTKPDDMEEIRQFYSTNAFKTNDKTGHTTEKEYAFNIQGARSASMYSAIYTKDAKLAEIAKKDFDTSFDEDFDFFDDMKFTELSSTCGDEFDNKLSEIGEKSDNDDDTLVVNFLNSTDNASSVDNYDIDKSNNSDNTLNVNQVNNDLIVEDNKDEAAAPKYTTMQALTQYYVNIPQDRASPSVIWVPRCTYWDNWEQDVVLHREDENPPDGWFLDGDTDDGPGPSSQGAPMASNRPAHDAT